MSMIPLDPWLAHRPRRGATCVDTVVLHASEGDDFDEMIRTLRRDDHSFHYIIKRDGVIVKGVPYSNVAFHCGNSYGPHEAARGLSYDRDVHGAFVEHCCINDYSIGICLMNRNDGEDPYGPDQWQACLTLIRDLKTPLPKLRYLTGHAMVAPNRATDPRGFDLAALSAAVELELWMPNVVSA